MLLLTRREGENIIIGDQIQIQILSVSKDPEHVRIGVESPDVLAVQCSDVSSEVTDRKLDPVITHKQARRVIR
ncbi:carbon storage regulator [Pseudomonas syringae pv. actinidiae]|uniref:carbon storage regulator n=1 Tax=Pseudomonas syringae group TaxID=136849 RepID=UPI0006B95DC2|nr:MULTISPECIES: carbon storage regulator [Pseudomonas syringae group]PBK54108.1 carbon storage regulator [Pseudomonas syringae pv. actinidiae]PBK54667.1 carbon storage regulator [Pseudomonas syringae pv. actinidiae]RJX48894.1 carbon storage regulator [Pseudomonas syringae pv. actinidiae]RJX52968.1 carbon storage regulator [Pseudomonas syringae pv. actinidiae]RJX57986.1 carbon storage regulator [Pseudomonas syringae pv. actinidiae]